MNDNLKLFFETLFGNVPDAEWKLLKSILEPLEVKKGCNIHEINFPRLLNYLLCFYFLSCTQQMKFETQKWDVKDDIFYKYRQSMVKDLMQNHLKKDMKYAEVVSLLGASGIPDSTEAVALAYEITVDYGWNIDPQSGSTLHLDFSKDSIYVGCSLI